MNVDEIEKILNDKTWVAHDDTVTLSETDRESLEDGVEPYLLEFKWTTETYISHGQIQLAFNDSDVSVNDIEAEMDNPVVWLSWEPEE